MRQCILEYNNKHNYNKRELNFIKSLRDTSCEVCMPKYLRTAPLLYIYPLLLYVTSHRHQARSIGIQISLEACSHKCALDFENSTLCTHSRGGRHNA